MTDKIKPTQSPSKPAPGLGNETASDRGLPPIKNTIPMPKVKTPKKN